jgi:hypothetical protein
MSLNKSQSLEKMEQLYNSSLVEPQHDVSEPHRSVEKIVIKDRPDNHHLFHIVKPIAIYKLLNPGLEIEYELKKESDIQPTDKVIDDYQEFTELDFNKIVSVIKAHYEPPIFPEVHDEPRIIAEMKRIDFSDIVTNVRNAIIVYYNDDLHDLITLLQLNFGYKNGDLIPDDQRNIYIDFVLHFYKTKIAEIVLFEMNNRYIRLCIDNKIHENIILLDNIILDSSYTIDNVIKEIKYYDYNNVIKYVIFTLYNHTNSPKYYYLLPVNKLPYFKPKNPVYLQGTHGKLQFNSYNEAESFALKCLKQVKIEKICLNSLKVLYVSTVLFYLGSKIYPRVHDIFS